MDSGGLTGRLARDYGSEGWGSSPSERARSEPLAAAGRAFLLTTALGTLPDWAIEVKPARLGRDNGTYEDAAIKKILSPYSGDRSAVTDCP